MPLLTIKRALLPINFRAGRAGPFAVDVIVIHVTEGDAASVVDWFSNPKANKGEPSNVSAHYMVRKDGVVVQFVDEDDTAWHAGRVSAPTAQLVIDRSPTNPNSYSIGIEHEGSGREPLTPAQRLASVNLIRDICARRGITIDRTHVVGHHEIFAPKFCPGAIDVDALVQDAAKTIATVADGPPAEVPRVVYSPHLGDYLIVTKYVSDGEWYFIPAKKVGHFVDGTRAGTPLSQMPRTKAGA